MEKTAKEEYNEAIGRNLSSASSTGKIVHNEKEIEELKNKVEEQLKNLVEENNEPNAWFIISLQLYPFLLIPNSTASLSLIGLAPSSAISTGCVV